MFDTVLPEEVRRSWTANLLELARLHREGLTKDQQSQWAHYRELKTTIGARKDTFVDVTLARVDERLPPERQITIKP